MKTCSKSHSNPDDALFCNVCGEKLPTAAKKSHKVCPKCKADNPLDAQFCHSCGYTFETKVNAKYINYRQFLRTENLNLLNRYNISKRLLVGVFGNTNDLDNVSSQTRRCLLLYGSPDAIKRFWLQIIPGINIIFLLYVLFSYPRRLIRLRAIEKNTSDIELNSKEIKLIHGKQNKMGLIRWTHCADCSLLLKSVYSSIKFVDDYNVIAEKNNKFGLYELSCRKWVLPCKYDSIEIDSNKNLTTVRDNSETTFNINGDRII